MVRERQRFYYFDLTKHEERTEPKLSDDIYILKKVD